MTMFIRPCPSCGSSTTRWLGAVSGHSWVNYYRCDTCGCAWTLPTGAPDTAPRIIAEGRTKTSGNAAAPADGQTHAGRNPVLP